MSEEFGLTTSGDGVVQVPVEKKDHSNDPVLTTQPVSVPAKKRGRPKKVVSEVTATVPVVTEPVKVESRKWHCSSCQEDIDDKNVMKIGAGDKRYAVFCPQCQRSFGFVDQVVLDTVAAFIKNNPTGKSAKA